MHRKLPVNCSGYVLLSYSKFNAVGYCFVLFTSKCVFLLHFSLIVKGKVVPLQAWSGPEGSRKLRSPDFMTAAQDGGKVVSLTHRPPLHPGNTPGTHFC